MDGKNWEWEGVVLIPFIDAAALRAATASLDPAALSPEERARNALGPNRRFVWDGAVRHAEPTPMPRHFPALRACPVRCDEEGFRPFPPDAPHFLPRLAPGVSLGAAAPPGFPSLLSRPLRSAVLQKAHVEVFGRKSRRETLCLRFAHEVPIADTAVVADGALLECPGEGDDAAGAAGARGAAGADAGGRGRLGAEAMLRALRQSEEVAFQWPFWCPVRVEALTDGDDRAWLDAAGAVRSERLGVREREEHRRAGEAHHALWQGRRAVDVGPVRVMVTVRPVQGMAATPRGGTERVWAREAQAVCAQCITVLDPSPRRPQHAAPDARFQPADAPPVRERFAAGDAALLLGDGPDMGRLVSVVAVRGAAHVEVALGPPPPRPSGVADEEFGARIVAHPPAAPAGAGAREPGPEWLGGGALCRALPPLTPLSLSKIMSSLILALPADPRRALPAREVDLGLQVKFERRGLAVPHLARRSAAGPWEYSRECRATLRAYLAAFPELARGLAALAPSQGMAPRAPDPADLLRAGGAAHAAPAEYFAKVAAWLAARPAASAALRPASAAACDPCVVAAIEQAAQAHEAAQGAAGAAEGAAETRTVHAARLVLPIRPGASQFAFHPGPATAPGEGARPRGGAAGEARLGDRVVNLLGFGAAAFGARGTVVGLEADALDVLWDREILGGSTLQGRCAGERGARVGKRTVLNLSRAWAAQRKARGEKEPHAKAAPAGAASRGGPAFHRGGGRGGSPPAPARGGAGWRGGFRPPPRGTSHFRGGGARGGVGGAEGRGGGGAGSRRPSAPAPPSR